MSTACVAINVPVKCGSVDPDVTTDGAAALEVQPDHERAWGYLGLIHWRLGAFAEAFGEAVDAKLPEEDLQPLRVEPILAPHCRGQISGDDVGFVGLPR